MGRVPLVYKVTVPAVGAGFMLAILLFHERTPIGTASRPVARQSSQAVPLPVAKYYPPAPPAPVPRASSDEEFARGIEEVRLRGTLVDYRNAVAQDNAIIQNALLPVLLRDREVVLQYAAEAVRTAPTDTDREIAQRTLDSLRR